jgi:hypothetical protein
MMARFDIFLIGRKIFDTMGRSLKMMPPNATTIVISRTLNPADYPGIRLSDNPAQLVASLRPDPGKDIALFGGGLPFLPPPAPQTGLKLLTQRLYQKTGIVSIEYDVLRS